MSYKAKHTPGPWAVERGFTVVAQDGKVAHMSDDTTRIPENARLIAAAPDLLEACKAVLADLEHYVSTHGPGPDRRLASLQAAIAKAEGK